MSNQMTVEENTINNNLCLCGKCNQQVTYNKYKPRKFVHGHNGKQELNGKWKGGKIIRKGYVMIKKPDHPFCDSQGYIYEHRLIMEEFLGRYLDPKEVVHHKDKNKLNNSINNLQLFSNNSDHISYELRIDISKRFCLLCNSKTTLLKKRDNRPAWYVFKNGVICNKCYMKSYNNKNRNKKK